ncbi:MAG TPA: hypothetical protein VFA34_16430 [Actinomycetota bacterium]|jgi:hypothetical protein|nr:hypothetical protein [Actinomycetota bacterium]
MTEEQEPQQIKGRDEDFWAKPVSELRVGHEVPKDAINLNVEGKRLAAMTGGFGKMWQKTYKIALEGASVTPEKVVKEWKQGFAGFWPKAGKFYGPLTEISPGDVALLNLKVGGPAKLSTGIFVLYADDVSFSFVNPEGHLFAGMITFSASDEGGTTTAQVQALIRAGDPFYELMMPLAIHRQEDKFWKGTLQNLARHFGVEGRAEMSRTVVDKKRQWSQWRNIKSNAALRTLLHSLTRPFRRRSVKPE